MNVEGALVGLSWPIRSVMELINRNGQGIAVVADNDRRVLATVTDGDIRRGILSGIDLDLPIQALLDQRPPASQRGPIVATRGTEVAELLKMMSEASIRHVPIVDAEGRITDIASLTEMLKEPDLPLTAVVMAGGYGTRLRPLTEELPKPMLPVGDRPLLELIIEQLCQAGIRRVNLATHYKKDVIAKHFGDGQDFGVEIRYVEEDQPLGTAGALGLLDVSDKPLLVINGDILTRVDFRAMLDFHREHQAMMTVAVRQHEFRVPYGVVDTDGVEVTGIFEKPMVRHFINAGIYLLDPEVCRYVPEGQNLDMPDLIGKLVAEGLRVVGFPVQEYWLDIGQVEDYERGREEINWSSG